MCDAEDGKQCLVVSNKAVIFDKASLSVEEISDTSIAGLNLKVFPSLVLPKIKKEISI